MRRSARAGRGVNRWAIRWIAAAGVVLAGSGGAAAQDVEALSALGGVPLPAAYYERVRSDPDAYEFARALRSRGGPTRALAPGRAGGPARTGVAGSVRLPVVLGLFSDSPTPHVTRQSVQATLFDGPSARGTVTGAYREMSRGAFEFTGDVFDWVRTSRPLGEVVGPSMGLTNDGAVAAYFREVLDSLDRSVDFRPYDNDGPDGVADSGDDDGFVDVITFEYLEVSAHCGGPAIWPHRWTLAARFGAPYTTNDVGSNGQRIRIDDYITQSATDCSGAVVQGSATMAHELGHALGLPDYYHWVDRSAGPRGRRWVLGCWDLMAAGSWGCGPVEEPPVPFGPTHLSAYSKQQLGWVDVVEIGEVWNQEIWLGPVQSTGVVLRLPLGGAGGESLLVEFRNRTGFDAELPAEGVLVYRHVPLASQAPSPPGARIYRLSLLEQDGNEALLRTDAEGGNRGERGDAWGGGGVTSKLHALTTPALRTSAGSATSVTLHEISLVGGRGRLVVSTGARPRLVPPAGAPSLPQAIRVAGGVMPYAVAATGLAAAPMVDGDAVLVSGGGSGAPAFVLSVTDALGAKSDPLVATSAGFATWLIELDDLLAPLLGPSGSGLGGAQLGHLDALGNANGSYDVGDLRRWMKENEPRPASPNGDS